MKESWGDIRRQNKDRIVQYVLEKKYTSRQKIATDLGYSVPTVVQNVKELIDFGLLCDIGEFESTGGRKAKMLGFRPGFCCAVGVEVTKSDVRFALLDIVGEIKKFEQVYFPYENTPEYYFTLGEYVQDFIRRADVDSPIAGVGISLPGVVVQELGILQNSYGLHISNIALHSFAQNIPYDVCFERDATSAARGEISGQTKDIVYLFLGSTVAGAIYIHSRFFYGDFQRAGGFGHSIIVPEGKKCFCGKRGCFAAYCSTAALLSGPEDTLDDFFVRVRNQDPCSVQVWDEYMDKLAIAVTNLRMDFDCSIVLGGEIAEFLSEYMQQIRMRMQRYNIFDMDTSYLSLGRYYREAASIGAARKIISQYIRKIDFSF